MGHKRKRDADATGAGRPAAKVEKADQKDDVSAAQKRQQKSERRSSKQKSDEGKPKRKRHAELQALPEGVETLLPGQQNAQDELRAGEDFVKLESAGDVKAKSSSTKKSQKPDRPRKIAEQSKNESNDNQPSQSKATRFITFVGNLPFSTREHHLKQHFSKLAPTSIRLSSDKKTGKPKGFAFVEFDNYDKMKTALKLYHHSVFDPDRMDKIARGEAVSDDEDEDNTPDGNGPRREADPMSKKRKSKTARMINVELTAGGGGGSKARKEKIQTKNTKLFEERERRKHAEQKGEMIRRKKRAEERQKSGANATEIGSDAVHPSRLRRVPMGEE